MDRTDRLRINYTWNTWIYPDCEFFLTSVSCWTPRFARNRFSVANLDTDLQLPEIFEPVGLPQVLQTDMQYACQRKHPGPGKTLGFWDSYFHFPFARRWQRKLGQWRQGKALCLWTRSAVTSRVKGQVLAYRRFHCDDIVGGWGVGGE